MFAGLLQRARWLIAVALLGCGDGQLSDTQAGTATSASSSALCQELAESEVLIGVSPEGEAWVEGDEGVRHLLPDGTSTPVDASFTRADALVAWDAAAAFVVGDNSLWSTTSDGAEPLALPPELGKPRFVCGDPQATSGAFVVTTRGLFERHNGTWLRWPFPIELLESIQIRDLQGACSGQQPIMYVEAGEILWEARYGDFASLREAADLAGMVAVGPDVRVGFVALRDGELLRCDGEGWIAIPFDEGQVTASSVADGVLWAAVDDELYRRNRFDEWESLNAPMARTTITEIRGYAAGGAWLVQGNELCHVQPRDTLRVNGVRLYGRLPEGSGFSVGVSGDPAIGSSLSAVLDGNGVQVSGSSGAWTLNGPAALAPGWHSLSLSARWDEGAAQRTVKFLVEGAESGETPVPPAGEPTVFWESDIRPIYERSCAACHGEGTNQTFLGSFEAFSALGQVALDRVSRGEMPPPAAGVAEPLTEDEVQLLATWVQEGMNP